MSSWLSESTASFLYDRANVALILALVVGAVSTVLVVWTGNVKEAYLKIELANTKERAANAEASAAEANEMAERERLERLRLQRQLAPRNLGPEEIAAVSNAISSFDGTAADLFVADPSTEAANLAGQINSALLGAHWRPATWIWTGMNAFSGIVIAVDPSKTSKDFSPAETLNSALAAASLSTEVRFWDGPWDQLPGTLNGPVFEPQRTEIRIIIGSKP